MLKKAAFEGEVQRACKSAIFQPGDMDGRDNNCHNQGRDNNYHDQVTWTAAPGAEPPVVDIFSPSVSRGSELSFCSCISMEFLRI